MNEERTKMNVSKRHICERRQFITGYFCSLCIFIAIFQHIQTLHNFGYNHMDARNVLIRCEFAFFKWGNWAIKSYTQTHNILLLEYELLVSEAYKYGKVHRFLFDLSRRWH